MNSLKLAKCALRLAAIGVKVKSQQLDPTRTNHKATCKSVHKKQVADFEQALQTVLESFFDRQLKSAAVRLQSNSKAFCPTGPGGGIDNSCSPNGGSAGAAVTRTAEFKAWFGDWEKDPANASKVVDSQGKPLVVYHGTGGDISEFDKDRLRANFSQSIGFHFSNSAEEAGSYAPDPTAGEADSGNIMAVYLNIRNPLMVDAGNQNASMKMDLDRAEIIRQIVQSRKTDNPYDGVIVTDSAGGSNYVVFDPNQIKSATGNSGAFDSNSADIRKSAESKAFCPTGPGGGIDNSCSPNGGGGSESPAADLAFGGNSVDRGGDTDKILTGWFGRTLTDDELSNISGAPAGSTIKTEVQVNSITGKVTGVYVEWHNPEIGGTGYRKISQSYEGVMFMTNVGLEIEKKGNGYGTQVFHQQVQTAEKLGISHISTLAEGPPKNGYYTWARLGYDGPINGSLGILGKTRPEELKDMKNVSELMESETGRAWWKANGGDIALQFDVTPGSMSREVLGEYYAERFGKRSQKSVGTDGEPAGTFGDGRKDSGQGLAESREKAREIARRIFRPEDWLDDLVDSVAPIAAVGMLRAVLAEQRLMKIDVTRRATKAFCPTGPGGGIDNSCSPNGGGNGGGGVQFQSDVTPKTFLAARDTSKRGAFLSPITEADLAGHVLILTADGKAGAAVSSEGDIQNVFNNGGPKGVGADVMLQAVDSGGVTLDCFAGFLPGYYGNFGFVETGRMKFNREYAPANWNYDLHGEPDVVFMSRTERVSHDEIRGRIAEWSSGGRVQPAGVGKYYEGSEWDTAKSDSRRIAIGVGSGKDFGSGVDRSGNSVRVGRVSGDNWGVVKTPGPATTKVTTATEWLSSAVEMTGDLLSGWLGGSNFGRGAIRFLTELPQWFKDEIQKRLRETFAKPYWKKINETTLNDIESHLSRGLQDGHSIARMAGEISQGLISAGESGDYAKVRAKNISRTESGHVLNAGRSMASAHMHDVLSDKPELTALIRRVWLSILGPTTRDAHADLDGVPENENGEWELGGIMCRWPGDISLPPENRCNCQCTVVSEFGMDADEAAELIAEYEARVIARNKEKAFCPTGAGGGIDNSCSPNGGGGNGGIKQNKPITNVKDAAAVITKTVMRTMEKQIAEGRYRRDELPTEAEVQANWEKLFRSRKYNEGDKGAFVDLDKELGAEIARSMVRNNDNPRFQEFVDKNGDVPVIYRRQEKGNDAAAEHRGAIHVYTSNFWKTESEIGECLPGQYTAALDGYAGVLRHEYGHHLYDSLNLSQVQEWVGLLPSSGDIKAGLTTYATTNPSEAFCELFAVATDTRYKAENFPEWVDRLHQKQREWFLK